MKNMKKLIAIFTICMAAFLTETNAQEKAEKSRLNEMLQSYFAVKDALVSGNSSAASAGATAFVKNINGISYEVISESNVSALVKDASVIAEAKDINKQSSPLPIFPPIWWK